MISLEMNASERPDSGTSIAKKERRESLVPCVLYGGEEKPIHFVIPEKDFKPLVYTSNVHTVDINLSGKKYPAVLKDIQFHPVSDKILHVDFYRLHKDKEIEMDVPVQIIGRAEGILLGGVLRKNYRKLRIKALPDNLPDFIEVDITGMQIGNKFYVTKLASDKYKVMHPDNTVVCQIKTSRNAMKAAAAK